MRQKKGYFAWALAWLCISPAAGLARASAADLPPSPAALLPVPEAPAQFKARQMIRKIYEKEFVRTDPADRRALARLLLAQARDTHDDPAARYVALADAADLAAGAGDAATALAAIDALAKLYAVSGLELRRTALARAYAVAGTPPDCEQVMHLALATAEEAVAMDAFDAVTQLANLAEAAANKTRQVKVVAGIQTNLAGLRALAEEFLHVKAAFTVLEKDATDSEAHLIIGRFYALSKGQWDLGLPHLVAGSDSALRDLAARELARPADGLAQTALGDGWWDYAEKMPASGMERSRAMVRAAHARDWYTAAQKSIQGITLARIASRINSANADSASASSARPTSLDVDLLTLVDPSKDTAQGKWTRTLHGLSCESSAYACAVLPYLLPEEYDLHVRFTRIAGEGSIGILLSAKGRGFGLALDVKGEARLERVDGKIAKDNPTAVPVAISNNHTYGILVEVRKDHVRALLDGKPLTEWKTDYKDMSRYAVWKLGDNTRCGIGANNAQVLFSDIELVEVAGKGKPAR